MNKNKKYLLIFLVVFIIGILILSLFLRETFWSLDNNNLNVKLSKEGWTADDVVVTASYNDNSVEIVKYSFDGGKSWQTENTYNVSQNTTLSIMVRSKSGVKTKVKNYEIKNIDKQGPKITIDKNIKITLGSNFNIKDYLEVTDDISGVKGNISITPNNIDTSNLGTTKVTIRAVDNAGNETVKEIYVEIIEDNSVSANMKIDDNNKKIEYRYREVKNECTTSNQYSTPSYNFGNISCSLYDGFTLGKYCLSNYIVYDDICAEGKMVNGTCHEIKAVAKVTCPAGSYDEAADQCVTTNETCIKSYGNWSDWTKEEVKNNENVEVETREVE